MQSMDCPMAYAVEVAQFVRDRLYTSIVARNLLIVDARDLASAYRQHEGCSVRILAYPAIPYAIPYTPQEVA